MCKSLRYCFSHCLYLAMTRLEEVNREVNMHSSVRYLGYLARFNLLVAICLGLYVRWEKTANSLILVIFILGLFVLGIASILYYYFSMEAASLSLSNLWFGFLLGLLCFLDNSSFKSDVKEETTKYLLLTSIVLRILCALVERLSGYVRHRPTLLTTVEFLELVGFAIASTTMLVERSLSVILLVMALAMLIIDLRMKSFLAIPNLIIFSVLLFFSSLETPQNPIAFACFFICLITDPFLDIYFSGLSVTERWKPFLYRGRICRRLSVVFTGMIELTFFTLSAFKLRDTHLWYFVIPGFSIFGIFWMICHIIFLLTLWGFHTKLNDCHKVYINHRADNNSLDRIMASKGMRHFCLISEQLVFFSLLATAILGAVSWQPTNGIFLSMFLIVLPLESMAHGLFHELGNCLGGTSVGYAIVIPTNFCSPDGQPTLLPPEHVQELNLRSTGMLNAIQRFFAYHMIETYGCDYSTSGLSFDTLHSKLKAFLELRTVDGPRHDTYVLYYSGHTHGSGEWALAGGDIMAFVLLLYMVSPLISPKPLALPGAHVVVTGGSSGIGKCIAIECYKQGAFITLVARNEDKLLQAKKEIEKYSINDKQVVLCISVDVSQDYNQVENVIKQAQEKLGPVDMLVNCAGTSKSGKFEELEVSSFEKLMSINYLGSVYPSRAVITTMKERRVGRIVFVSSQAGQLGLFGFTAYSSSKFAIRGLAEALQMEVKPYNVYVTVAYPPDTDTPGLAEENKTKPLETRLISETTAVCKPEQVAKQIVKDAIQGNFNSSIGSDGYMLSSLTCGMAPVTSITEGLQQVVTMGLFRTIALFYLGSFDNIIRRCMVQKRKPEVGDKTA